ncbi:hypothetical protein RRG08_025584 [Elysia crispata]|uniref:Uncharacterized protein n=1 Tax=Elysia crispata TaxID=231223 RepID=A0AAE0YE84_9GAST|nr:hypothetical protein RRG08_025584 [Elysia crispata]
MNFLKQTAQQLSKAPLGAALFNQIQLTAKRVRRELWTNTRDSIVCSSQHPRIGAEQQKSRTSSRAWCIPDQARGNPHQIPFAGEASAGSSPGPLPCIRTTTFRSASSIYLSGEMGPKPRPDRNFPPDRPELIRPD